MVFLLLACTKGEVEGIELIEARNQTGLVREMDDIVVLREGGLRVVGRVDGEVAAVGYGADDAEAVLFAELGRIAWLDDLEESRTLGAAVALGEGRFLYAGGASRADEADGETAIELFDLFGGSPLGSEHAGALPDDGTTAGRVALAAGVADGRVLFTGGAAAIGTGDETALASTVVWEDGETRVGPPLTVGRAHHVQHGRALVGGRTLGDGEMVFRDSAEELQGGAFVGVGTTDRVFGHAAADTDDGVLVCGGAAFNSQGQWSVTDGCDRVDGSVERVAELPAAVAFGAMVEVGDAVLFTGGTQERGAAQWDLVPASDEAWLFEDGAWTEVGPMRVPRANHRMVPLGDGRALVVGGVSEIQLEYLADETIPYSCAELWDGSGFELLDSCDELVGSLPEPTAVPAVATEPGVGSILVGGTRLHAAAARQVGFVPWVPSDD